MLRLYNDFISFFDSKQKNFIYYLIFLIIIGTFLETISIALIVPAINLVVDDNFLNNFPYIFELLNNIANKFSSNNFISENFLNKNKLIFFAIVFIVLIFSLKTIFLIYSSKKQAHLPYLINGYLSKRFFEGYLKLDFPFFLKTHTSKLTHIINNEVANLITSLSSFITIFIELLIIVCLVSLLLYFEPKGGIIVIFLFFTTSYIFHYFTKQKILKWGISRRLHQQQRLKHIQQGFGNIKNIKIFDVRENFSGIYSHHNEIYSRMLEKHFFFQTLPRFWLELIVIISLSLLVLTIVMQERSINELVSVLGLYAAASFRLLPSMNRILTNLQNLKSFSPVVKNLKKELNLINDFEKKEIFFPSEEGIVFSKSIEIKKMTFSYENTKTKVLNLIDLEIKKADKLGIMGSTGAGKSTLINILLGLLEPDEGQVQVDDKSIFKNIKSWRKLIGYVPQDVYLSDDTIKNNICFVNKNTKIDDKRFDNAIKNSQLRDFVNSLENKEQTLVGENGIRISGGQRQRIGIARALYREPKILILDEATSALDIDTENNILETISRLDKNLTLIIISHRMNTLKKCEKIYKIEKGKINLINNK